mgnify:CR=1 FL=1
MEDGYEGDRCFLKEIYERPSLVRQLSRGERVTAFSQLMMVAGLIVPALMEATEQGGGLKDPDFEFADDFWTVKELAAKLRVSPRTVYAGIKSGKYPFAIADGRNVRISRLGFQKWAKHHTK